MRDLLGRILHEIAQGLESADGYEYRIVRVLGLLREIVPFEQCALLMRQAGREPQLLLEPGASPDERAALAETLGSLLGRLVDERARPPAAPTKWQGAHLAVPIIVNDEAIGVLFVRESARLGAVSSYTEEHLRELAIVGAHLAGYLAMVEHARALDDARREAEAVNRIKDEVLALVSRDLKTPLTSVLAWAHTLRFDETGPCARSLAVEAIERNVEAQAKLIDEILSLSSVATAEKRLAGPAALVDEPLDRLVIDPARVIKVISSLLVDAVRRTTGVPPHRAEARPQLAGIRVLLVDDDEDMRLAATAVLELHGAEVTAVGTAAAALAALEHARPHVLLSDIGLPDESGYELMRKVSASNLEIPSAAVTALVRAEDRTRAFSVGFRMHIAKPFRAEQIVAAVAALAGDLRAS